MKGYYRFPTVSGKTVVFVCEDELWKLDISKKDARRLTSIKGYITNPVISPDGKNIAFTSSQEGANEIFLMPIEGGVIKRLTYFSSISNPVAWKNSEELIISSNYRESLSRVRSLFSLNINSGKINPLRLGPANHISYAQKGKGMVIGRNTGDPARWKRYRGGTAGELWIDLDGKMKFNKLTAMKTNVTSPMWIGERIYFISDHEGIGNIYSVNKAGKNINRHSDMNEYYVRNASTDGKSIVFHAGSDLFILDIAKNKVNKLDFELHSTKDGVARKFVSAKSYLEDFSPAPNSKAITYSTRGSVFSMNNFEGPVFPLQKPSAARQRLPKFFHDGKKIAVISDESGEDAVKIFKTGSGDHAVIIKEDIGRVVFSATSPTKDMIALTNHRNEVIMIDIKTKEKIIVHKNKFSGIHTLNWSPDGKFITYAAQISTTRTAIFVYDITKKKEVPVTEPILWDHSPAFSSDGKYIYFISVREFDPVYDQTQFELSFPRAEKIYVIPLSKDTKAPFEYSPEDKEKDDEDDKTPKGKAKKAAKKKVHVKIHFSGIKERIAELPFPLGIYGQVGATDTLVFALDFPIQGSLSDDIFDTEAPAGKIKIYDYDKKKVKSFFSGANYFYLTDDHIFIRSHDDIRVFSNKSAVSGETAGKSGKEGGHINVARAKIAIEPIEEWRQMFSEAWRLQRDNFWNEKMSNIDWVRIFKRYSRLIPRLGSRSEFSDLVWEMQGELGTSHCYEFGGDYSRRTPPRYPLGKLGGEFVWNQEKKGYEITRILRGDTWNKKYRSPLQTPGTAITQGDVIKAIDGIHVKKDLPLEEMLLNKAATYICLKITNTAGKTKDEFIKTTGSEVGLRYREWVEGNRKSVHEKTSGKIGYVHIPDMGAFGFSEFHRYFLAELEYEGLIVDVRFNGGGHVSQLLLEKLARKRLGYDIQRWGVPESYPAHTVAGPIVILTNEHAGSDGDIFSHSLKLLNLGTLIGKRTWGGVIGIWPRHFLSDGTITTQPEFSFWFKDVGWGVENYGTDPDIEVEITPAQYRKGFDSQLERGIKEVMAKYKKAPPKMPDFSNKPNLKLPKLPKK